MCRHQSHVAAQAEQNTTRRTRTVCESRLRLSLPRAVADGDCCFPPPARRGSRVASGAASGGASGPGRQAGHAK